MTNHSHTDTDSNSDSDSERTASHTPTTPTDAAVSDGGWSAPEYEVGEAVKDATQPTDEAGTCRVLDPDAGRADAVRVGTTGKTVSEFAGNEDYPADGRVVTVVYESDLNSNIVGWEEWTEDKRTDLAEFVAAFSEDWSVAIKTYDYPEGRLRPAGDGDPADAENDENDKRGDGK
jgi:hypothetical protein